MNHTEIKTSTAYSNGDFGKNWSVWQVIDIHTDSDGQLAVKYRVMAGRNRRKTFGCSLDEFAEKVRYEVELNENSWKRVE